jgi:hypothetical protein
MMKYIEEWNADDAEKKDKKWCEMIKKWIKKNLSDLKQPASSAFHLLSIYLPSR